MNATTGTPRFALEALIAYAGTWEPKHRINAETQAARAVAEWIAGNCSPAHIETLRTTKPEVFALLKVWAPELV